MEKLKLLLILADPFGNMVPTFTFSKKLSSLLDTQEKPNEITLHTNNGPITCYKYYFKSSLTSITKLVKKENIEQINIICFNEIYKQLTNETDKYIEPQLSSKINVFNLFHFMPFTTISIENLLIQLSEKFIDYRLEYLYKNVPVTDLTTNDKSLSLLNHTTNFYKTTKYSLVDNFSYSNKSVLHFHYEFLFDYLNNNSPLILPKLRNMNMWTNKEKLTLSSEDCYKKNINYQKIMFFIKTYQGLFYVKKCEFNFEKIIDNTIKTKLLYIKQLIKPNDIYFISFELMKEIIDNYYIYIEEFEINEVYFSSSINISEIYLNGKDFFYQLNFLLELLKNSIYKIIILQKLIPIMVNELTSNNYHNFGIFFNQCLCYISNEDIEKMITKEEENKLFNYVIPLGLVN